MHPAPFVWPNDDTKPRMAHAYFRRELTLTDVPPSATIHLYADTNYHLFVNGEHVGFGPARAYPEFPEYDTYYLSAVLRSGANVIAVHVLHVGLPTFHNLTGKPGFVAWGEAGPQSLSTESGWLCRLADGYEHDTAIYSFAQAPIQVYDERLDAPGWNGLGQPEGDWQPAVPVADQDAWGELRPRTIPLLTQDVTLPNVLLGAYAHTDDEEIVSFRLKQTPDEDGSYPPATAFACTYVHSPRAQSVTVGTYWGDHFLNGKRLEQQPQRTDQILRNDAILELNEGWNFLFISYGMVQGIWEMHLAVPREAGLTLTIRSAGSEASFLTAGPYPQEEADALLHDQPWEVLAAFDLLHNPQPSLPLQGEEELGEDHWTPQPRLPYAISPQKALAWAKFGPALAHPAWQVRDFNVPAGQSASLVFDMGREVLGRIFVDYNAPAGTVIDVGHAETLRNERPEYGKMALMSDGERQIARGGAGRLETFYPRGFRYLHIAVSGHEAPVTLHKIGAISQLYPYTKQGSFECSDPFLNTLWEYGWNTLRLCSEAVITDCPWRERTLYAGDLLPETATALAVSGDPRLPRRCVELFLQSQNPDTGGLQSMAPIRRDRSALGDYPLITVIIADWLCRYSNDVTFAERCAPVFRQMLAGLAPFRGADGLYVLEGEIFLDWTDMTKTGPVCALNALAVRALDAWASLLALIGEDAEADQFKSLARQTARAVGEWFWDEGHGAFADTLQDGARENSHYVLSTAWPMLAAVTSPDQDTRGLAHVRSTLSRFEAAQCSRSTSPYGTFCVLGALYEKGAAGLAEEAMRRLYSDMITHPTGTLWEVFHTEWSLCHAWASAPTYYLSTRALGVRLGFPDVTDFDSVLIAPESETLDWARGAVPHPRGLISVEWAVRGDRLVLSYDAPEGVDVSVQPRGRLASLRLCLGT